MSHAAAVKLAAQYRKFLACKQYLTICSACVKHVRDIKEDISSTHSNMSLFLYRITLYYI